MTCTGGAGSTSAGDSWKAGVEHSSRSAVEGSTCRPALKGARCTHRPAVEGARWTRKSAVEEARRSCLQRNREGSLIVPEENIEGVAWRACVDAGWSQRTDLESLAVWELGDWTGQKGVGN
jgi:hypothetical protein